mgnify:CR=1 FL=1
MIWLYTLLAVYFFPLALLATIMLCMVVATLVCELLQLFFQGLFLYPCIMLCSLFACNRLGKWLVQFYSGKDRPHLLKEFPED